MKQEDVVVTSTTIAVDHQDLVELGVLWIGFLIAACITGWHVYSSHKQLERDESSSGDMSRSLFYKLLFIALLSRTVFIPIQITCGGEMIQLVADTLPQLTFASAWALLVAFFGQLVATASGTVSSNKPSLLIHIACYLTYILLITLYWWNDAAEVLLEAGLCCLYAALFCTILYFGPKLVLLLKPSLERQSGLALRLISCCTIGTLVFLLKSISLARTVVIVGIQEQYWYTYGLLELLPATLLLIMMHPSQNADSPNTSNSAMRRSTSSTGGQRLPQQHRGGSGGEVASLLKPQVQYGTTTMTRTTSASAGV